MLLSKPWSSQKVKESLSRGIVKRIVKEFLKDF